MIITCEHIKRINSAVFPSLINLSEKWSIYYTLCFQLCSTSYTVVQIKNYSKSTFVIKVATMKNMDDFPYTKEAIMCFHQIDIFSVNKDEWNIKKDINKSMKNALYILWYDKRHLLDRSSKKNQACNLSCYWVSLSEESVSMVSLSVIRKFCSISFRKFHVESILGQPESLKVSW